MPDASSEESTAGHAGGVRAVGGPTHAAAARRIEALLRSRRHALVIGIDAYAPEVGPLAGAVADARAVADVLRDPARRDRFDPVTLLVDRDATRAAIEAAFAALRAQLDAEPNARVLIYFAGHGLASALPEEAETDTPGYLLPQDARRGDPSSFVSMRALRGWIDALGCHHLLLVLDCCFAGAFRWAGARATRATPRQLYHERLERHLRDPAWHVITSAAHDERALDVLHPRVALGERAVLAEGDRSGARSPFAVAFVEGLQGKADFASVTKQRPDGVITGGELHTWLEQRFGEWEGEGRRLQKPLLFPWPGRRDNKGEFVFLNPREALRLESAGELLEANNPYRGLLPFRYDARDAALFFGRDALVGRLFEKVAGGAAAGPDASRGEAVVVVLGASGTGKSSLVAAGLLPKLAAAGWTPASDPVRPGGAPPAALRHLALAMDPTAPDEPLAETARRFFARDPGARRVAVVDQLEELVTLRQGRDLRAEFLAALDGAVEASGGRLRVVYTLRSDFEPHFARELIAKHPGGRFRVTPMSRDELREAIEKPAEARVLQLTPPELVDAIIDEVIDAPGALPLLSFTLSEMYLHYVRAFREGTRDDRALTGEDYERLGRVEGSLSRRADELYERFDAATRATMRRVMLRMLSIEGAQPTRRPARVRELTYGPEEDVRVREVLRELTEARLVVGAADERGGEFVEPAHDKIVLGWPRLIEWLNEPGQRERLDALQLVRERAADWVGLGRAGGWLDRDARLDRWAELAAGEGSPFNAEEVALLQGSLRRRDEEREAERRRVAALEEALSRARDHARMSALRDTEHDPTMQVALLREVEKPERTLRWEEAARRLLSRPDVAPLVFEPVGAPDPFAWRRCSPDGVYVFDGAMLWRTDGTGSPLDLRSGEGDVLTLFFSPDGTHVITASQRDSVVRVWRTDGTGEPVVVGAELSGGAPQFSRDGTHVLLEFFVGKTARVCRVGGPGEPFVVRHHNRGQSRSTLSPDGGRVATWSTDLLAEDPNVYVCRVDGAGEPVVLRGGKGRVDSAVFSPDGGHVLIMGKPVGRVRVCRADGTGEPLDLGPGENVIAAMFSPDGTRVLTLSEGGTGHVDRVDGAGEPVALKGSGKVAFAQFSPDGARVLVKYKDMVRVWAANETGDPLVLRSPDGTLLGAEFSPDGAHVLTSFEDGTLRVWRTDGTGEPLVLRGHEKTARFVFSRDGARVLTTSDDDTVRVWSTDGTSEPLVLRGGRGYATFSSDGARIVTGARDHTTRVWRVYGTCEPLVLPGPGGGPPRVTYSRGGTHVLARSHGSDAAHVWRTDGSGGHVVLRGPAREGGLFYATLSPDGAHALTACNATARVWRTDGSGRHVALRGHEKVVTTAMFSPDGVHVLTGADDDTVRLWRIDGTGEPVVLRGLAGGAENLAVYSPDGAHVLVASQSASLWRADGKGEPLALRGYKGGARSAAFSPDGTCVLINSTDGMARVWRIVGRRKVVLLKCPHGDIGFATFSPDGARLLTWSQNASLMEERARSKDPDGFALECVRVWRADGAGEPVVLEGCEEVPKGAFSPDGAFVLGKTRLGRARVWRADGRGDAVALRLPDHTSIMFSPDGLHVLGADHAGDVHVCRADGTGEPVGLRGPGGGVTLVRDSVAFSPDGARVFTAYTDGTVRVWRWARWSSIPEMLWSATTYCLPVKERMAILGETEEEATAAYHEARRRVAELAARGAYGSPR